MGPKLVKIKENERKKLRGNKDQLVIDKMALKDCKRRHTNLSAAWIDYRKAYNMVPHFWIKECMKLAGIVSYAIRGMFVI